MVLVDELKKPNIILASISYGQMKEKPLLRLCRRKRVTTSTLTTGTLRCNDADGNENVKTKKTIGLISKTTTLHVHHAFLYISFLFLHDYDVKMANFAFYGGRKQATTKFYFSF